MLLLLAVPSAWRGIVGGTLPLLCLRSVGRRTARVGGERHPRKPRSWHQRRPIPHLSAEERYYPSFRQSAVPVRACIRACAAPLLWLCSADCTRVLLCCREMDIVHLGEEVTVKGIPLLRYRLPPSELYNSTLNPGNAEFFGDNSPSGILNISNCNMHIPVGSTLECVVSVSVCE